MFAEQIMQKIIKNLDDSFWETHGTTKLIRLWPTQVVQISPSVFLSRRGKLYERHTKHFLARWKIMTGEAYFHATGSHSGYDYGGGLEFVDDNPFVAYKNTSWIGAHYALHHLLHCDIGALRKIAEKEVASAQKPHEGVLLGS
jgi:hypothetical protein